VERRAGQYDQQDTGQFPDKNLPALDFLLGLGLWFCHLLLL
jgi:hypothetical protein